MSFPRIPKDQLDKAKRKKIPLTSRAWISELEGIEKFIKKKPRNLDDSGAKWYASISEYYIARLYVLSRNPPANIPKIAAVAIVKRLVRSL